MALIIIHLYLTLGSDIPVSPRFPICKMGIYCRNNSYISNAYYEPGTVFNGFCVL